MSLYDVPAAAAPGSSSGRFLEVDVDFSLGATTVRVRGRLDLATVHRLDDVLLCARLREPREVVLHLDGLTGCDRYAAANLRARLDELRAAGVLLRLVAGPRAFRMLTERGFSGEV